MALQLTEAEVRVLGALVEKEITTPEYYPLSVNALMNACNQKSNREPVMTLDEEAVRQALRSMSEQALVRSAGGDSRVPKYEHRLNELYNFHRHEIAVLCVLMLRGPQTPGELRTRAERMYAFEDLEAVHAALNLLMRREPALVKVLPRQPGTKESRYTASVGRRHSAKHGCGAGCRYRAGRRAGNGDGAHRTGQRRTDRATRDGCRRVTKRVGDTAAAVRRVPKTIPIVDNAEGQAGATSSPNKRARASGARGESGPLKTKSGTRVLSWPMSGRA